jgi:hypothetical protein
MVSCPTAASAPDYAGGMTPGPCNGVSPPPRDAGGYTLMDLNGRLQKLDPANAAAYPTPRPLLSYYPGVWGNTIFSRGHSPIQVTEGLPGLLGAKTVVPSFRQPYATCASKQTDAKGNTTCDPADKTYASPIETLVPWTAPGTPGLGFGIPINGQSDQFINTGQLDFTGILESYTVDYLPWSDTVQPSCTAGPCRQGFTCNAGQCVAGDNTIRVAAIEANDFVGAVFPCQDQLTGDILVVHQYDPTLAILDWLALHPGIPPAGNFGANGGVPSARDACNVIVRFSPYNNYPDKISFNANGVWFNSDTGNGYGRIADVMLFDTAFKTM